MIDETNICSGAKANISKENIPNWIEIAGWKHSPNPPNTVPPFLISVQRRMLEWITTKRISDFVL